MDEHGNSRSDRRDPHRARGPGLLHPTDDADTYRARQAPGRNDPCPCGSGKKAKKCHPAGLRAHARQMAKDGACDACGAKDRTTALLRHDGAPGRLLARVCIPCVQAGPEKALAAILARQAPPSLVPPLEPPSVPNPPAPAPRPAGAPQGPREKWDGDALRDAAEGGLPLTRES